MISSEVEDRIAHYYFQRYFPDEMMEELEELLLPFYLNDEEPSVEDMVKLAIKYIDDALEE